MKRVPAPVAPFTRRRFLAGASAIGLSLMAGGARADGERVNVYNWPDYLPPDTLAGFHQTSGITAHHEVFTSDDELFARLRGSNPGFDLIVPGNTNVERMAEADMLMPLEHARIANLENIDPFFLDPPFDPGRQFSLPYLWGSIGIGYRKSALAQAPRTWRDLFEGTQDNYRIALLREPMIVTRLAIKALGESLNDLSEANVQAARRLLDKRRNGSLIHAPDNGQDLLLSGEVDMAMEWNTDIMRAMEQDDDIAFVLPEEGGLLWEDSLCIPKGAPNVDNAYALINFLLSAEAGAAIARYTRYATPNTAALALLDPTYTNNPAIIPSPTARQNSQYPTGRTTTSH
ncbi:ABC transporter substrate-binding protein [Granulosicoccus sp. 3-233]|uniref:ABC transporter substrate-binding protein n=1 Tax=Granulosicoccus sp. 3-233 TaxID=3417969 RepID=UPI003D3364C2